jgi:hypothetical protein
MRTNAGEPLISKRPFAVTKRCLWLVSNSQNYREDQTEVLECLDMVTRLGSATGGR